MSAPIVFYLNPGATPEVLRTIREALPQGWRLTHPEQSTEFSEHLEQCDYILVADRAITAEHIRQAPKLRMIQHQGVGYERIDLRACHDRRIPVALTPEGTSVGVAEHTLLLILALYKQLVQASRGVGQGKWLQWELRHQSFELAGKTLGLVGLGRIGTEVAKRALAFDATVRYHDPFTTTKPNLPVTPCADAADLLSASDIVSLHIPLIPETRHWINPITLRQMKPGAVLINTARGGLVDEPALLAALRDGPLRGAALDVLESEPPALDNPLIHMDNVLISPHIAAGTVDALRAKMKAAFANLQRFHRNQTPRHVVPELRDINVNALQGRTR